MLYRIRIGGLVALLAWLPLVAVAEPTPGLQATRPADGRFVETDKGFMVPYLVKIPGTSVQFRMVPIPGGTFRMGSPESESKRRADEGPQVKIQVAPFWMAEHEVTWAEYKQYMRMYNIFKEFETQQLRAVNDKNMADAVTAPTELYDPSFTFEYGEHPQQPAVTMTQFAAKQYTKWLSGIKGEQYRLPTEAEWEYACRAGTETAYSFGDDRARLDDYGWYYDNAGEGPSHVATKKPNPWGLYDMHGNVWEWVIDEYFEDGYARLKGKTLTADKAIAWPTKAFPRVVRGGSWESEADRCRSAARLPSHDEDWKAEDPNLPLSPWWFTSDPARGVGFRIVRPLRTMTRPELAKFWEPDVEDVKFDVQDRLTGGRGVLGLVDETLPEAVQQLEN